MEINIQLAFFGLNFNTMFLTLGIESKTRVRILGIVGYIYGYEFVRGVLSSYVKNNKVK